MCRAAPAATAAPAAPAAGTATSAPEPQLELRIVGALSGESLIQSLFVKPEWTVRRLRLELEHLGAACAASGAHAGGHRLFLEGRPLGDGEELGAALPGDVDCHTVQLLRLAPQAPPAERALPRTRALRALRVESAEGGSASSVAWQVDAKFLLRKDRHVASPTFSLHLGPSGARASFKIAIYASDMGSFLKSGGRGHIQLKCAENIEASGPVSFCVYAGRDGEVGRASRLRGPFPHNFATNSVARAPKGEDLFDFRSAVDPASGTFEVGFDLAFIDA